MNAVDPDGRQIIVIAKDPRPPTMDMAGFNYFLWSSAFFHSLSSGFGVFDVATARQFYLNEATHQSLLGNDLAAAWAELLADDVIPESQADLGIELAAAMIPGGKGGKIADDLIRGSLKASKSYRAELGKKTYAEIIKLSKGKGPTAQAAKQMKKLIEQSERLLDKVRGKP